MQLIEKILIAIERDPKNGEAYSDAMNCIMDMKENGLEFNVKLRKRVETALGIALKSKDYSFAEELYNIHKNTYIFGGKYLLEDFIFGMEYDRPAEKQFYLPRKQPLSQLTSELQRLLTGELDLLCISLSPGVGKTTIAIFAILWAIGRDPNSPILSGSHSTALMRGVYEECSRMATSDEYNFAKIFPESPLIKTNAQDLSLDFKTHKRFSSLQFTSVGSGNAGRLRAMQLLYCDDLCSGIEEAMSKERLDSLWQKYTVDLKQRKMGSCPELHIATRWSVHDVIGRLERENVDNERAKFITIPALDENGESNFDYKYGVGYTTANYMDLKDSMDDVSWRALYMNEPIEREGLLYHTDELRRFYDLPNSEPDAILAVTDTKDRGKDYAVMIVAYLYGKTAYIADIVCTNALGEVTDGLFADTLIKNKVHSCRFESNAAGGRTADKVQELIKLKGGNTHITKKYTTANKETKIVVNSHYVKENFVFLDKSKIPKRSQYADFMRMFCSYTISGKNKFDDTVDCAAMLAEYIQSLTLSKVAIFDRPF